MADELEKLREKVRKDPNSKLFVPLAEIYRKAGMLEEAIGELKEGLERQPGYMSARVALGKIYMEKEMKAEAREEFEKVVEAIPDNLFAQKKLAELCLELGDKLRAGRALHAVIKLNPMDEGAASMLAGLEGSSSPAAARPGAEREDAPFAAARDVPPAGAEPAASEQEAEAEAEGPVSFEELQDVLAAAVVDAEAVETERPVAQEEQAEAGGTSESPESPESPEAPEAPRISEPAAETEPPTGEFELAEAPPAPPAPEEIEISEASEVTPEVIEIPDASGPTETLEVSEAAGMPEALEEPEAPEAGRSGFATKWLEPAKVDSASFTSVAQDAIKQEETRGLILQGIEYSIEAADAFVAEDYYGPALFILNRISEAEPANRTALQRRAELKALIKMLGKRGEVLRYGLTAFLERMKKRRNEFLRNA